MDNNINVNVDMTIDMNALSQQKGLLVALRAGYDSGSETGNLLEGVIQILDCIEDKIEASNISNDSVIEVNPTEDIKFFLENSGCYDEEVERMSAAGAYEMFIAEIDNEIDWDEVGDNMRVVENEAIARAVDWVLTTKRSYEDSLTTRQFAAEVVEILDDYLCCKGIEVPCTLESEEEDRKGDGSCCALYGSEYWNLVDFLENTLNANVLGKNEIANQLLDEFELLLKSKGVDLQDFNKERGKLLGSISYAIA